MSSMYLRIDVIAALDEAKSVLAYYLEGCGPAEAAELARLNVHPDLAALRDRFERATAEPSFHGGPVD